jgi:sulfate permease, SulP family
MRFTVRGRALAWLRSVRPRRDTLKADAMGGLPGAIGSVPDGMAASVLAGVNPSTASPPHFVGPVAGRLSAITKLMLITTTSLAGLAAGSALEDVAARPIARLRCSGALVRRD